MTMEALASDKCNKSDIVVASTISVTDYGTIVDIEANDKMVHLRKNTSVLHRLRRGEEWLDRKLGLESQGIDRIPQEDREVFSPSNVFFLWWSFNIHVASLPVGMMGPFLGLPLRSSIVASIAGSLIGSLCVGFTATLGPKLGLRQIAAARYSFGYYGSGACALLNVVTGAGFAIINFVVVGQLLSAATDFQLSICVGILMVAVTSVVISVFGLQVINVFEKYSWLPTLAIMTVMAVSSQENLNTTQDRLTTTGPFLSFLAINIALSSGCAAIAADYYCKYSAKTPSWRVFSLTYWGNCFSIILIASVGACLGNRVVNNEAARASFSQHGLGGLIQDSLHPLIWAKLSLFILTLSVLGSNVANIYSCGLSIQLLGESFRHIPRSLLSLLFGIAITVLAIAGKEHLLAIVKGFVSLLGFYTTTFSIILFIEDKLFRRYTGYDVDSWNEPDRLPVGIAAVIALTAGYFGSVPEHVRGTLGIEGGDCDIYMSVMITLLVYPAIRLVEKRKMGR